MRSFSIMSTIFILVYLLTALSVEVFSEYLIENDQLPSTFGQYSRRMLPMRHCSGHLAAHLWRTAEPFAEVG
jgi:hypothetical protein